MVAVVDSVALWVVLAEGATVVCVGVVVIVVDGALVLLSVVLPDGAEVTGAVVGGVTMPLSAVVSMVLFVVVVV